MDNNAKNRFDALATIWESSWKRIQERRSTEWRLTLTIWTGLGSLEVLVLSGKVPFYEFNSILRIATSLFLIGAGCLLLIWHYKFLINIGIRHNDDREIADKILEEMAKIDKLDFLLEIIDNLKKFRQSQRQKLDWSRRLQWNVSLLLTIALFFTMIVNNCI
ncbi:MAG: hypothetical protein MUP16_06740 [Sedimentisphaerales bacterium]|nr:hypothetical protein [Sedimentisphaerales bacterium]